MHVAFVRNCNQGQRGHPSTGDLIDAFTAAGASDVTTFRSNGTVVFDIVGAAGDGRADGNTLDSVVTRAAVMLADASGSYREVFHLPLATLATIAGDHGFANDAHRRELSLHDVDVSSAVASAISDPTSDVIAATQRGRITLLASGDGWTVSANERERESNATPVLERIVGSPVTSRGFPTVLALLERAGG